MMFRAAVLLASLASAAAFTAPVAPVSVSTTALSAEKSNSWVPAAAAASVVGWTLAAQMAVASPVDNTAFLGSQPIAVSLIEKIDSNTENAPTTLDTALPVYNAGQTKETTNTLGAADFKNAEGKAAANGLGLQGAGDKEQARDYLADEKFKKAERKRALRRNAGNVPPPSEDRDLGKEAKDAASKIANTLS